MRDSICRATSPLLWEGAPVALTDRKQRERRRPVPGPAGVTLPRRRRWTDVFAAVRPESLSWN